MAGISLGMGFDLQAQSYLDIRQSFETLATMKSFPETSVPEGFIAYNKETKLEYQFDPLNSDDPNTGKWRLKKSGGADIKDSVVGTDTTYSSAKIEELFKSFGGFLIVESLPDTKDADLKKIYLIKDEDDGEDPNAFNEYIVTSTITYVEEAHYDMIVDASTYPLYTDYEGAAQGASYTPVDEPKFNEIRGASYSSYDDYKKACPDKLGWELLGSTQTGKLEYKTTTPVNNPMGKVPAGYTTNGIAVTTLLDMMLHKDVLATATISCSDAGLKEKGVSSVTDPVLTATINPGTCTPVSVQFYKDGSPLGSPVPFSDGQLTYTLTDNNSGSGVTLTDTTTYGVVLTYKVNKDDLVEKTTLLSDKGATYTYKFVYPFYYGVSLTTPTDESGLTKELSDMPTNKSVVKAYTGTNVYAVLLFDSNYSLSSVLDQNGFECMPGFTTKNIVVGSGSYTLAYTTSPATLNNFKYTFKFA